MSSITWDRWLAEFIIISAYFEVGEAPTKDFTFYAIGIIEFNGVRSSCAIEEKNFALSF